MNDMNELLNSLPDYDVLSESEGSVGKPRKRRQKPRSIAERDRADYNDGFGVYIEKREYTRNFFSVFFFPLAILWLELALRFGSNGDFGFNSLLYTFMFTVVAGCALSFLCTLGGQRFNRVLSDILTLILTLWFVFQLLFKACEGCFFTFSRMPYFKPDDFVAVLSEKWIVIAAMFVPFLFNLIFGRRLLPFRRIRIPAKITLLLITVLFWFSTATMISLSKHNPYVNTSYNLFNLEFKENESADRFGLLTMQTLDVKNVIFK